MKGLQRFANRMNRFIGDDIYLTDKSIAVRRVSTTQDKHGNYRMYDKTKYYPKTKSNLAEIKRMYGYVRKGR